MSGNTFQTSDIVVAAYLVASKHKMNSISKAAQKGTFHFLDVPPEVITQYDMGQALIEPASLNNAIKHLTTAVRRLP